VTVERCRSTLRGGDGVRAETRREEDGAGDEPSNVPVADLAKGPPRDRLAAAVQRAETAVSDANERDDAAAIQRAESANWMFKFMVENQGYCRVVREREELL
jgi:hypothetical protein